MTKKTIDSIITRLMQEDQRWSAVLELKVAITDPKCVPLLVAHLKNKDWVVRWSIAEKLGDLKSPDALSYLIELLADPDAHVRKNAFNALLKFKRDAIFAVVPYFDHSNPLIRQGVFSVLVELGDDTIPILESLLSSHDWIVANRIVHTIWAIGGKRAEFCLIRCLSNPFSQKNTIMLLSLLKSEAAILPLLELSLEPRLKKFIFQAFAKMGESKVFPVIVSTIWTHAKPKIRALSEKLVLKIGNPILPYLVKALATKGCDSNKVFLLLEKVGPESAFPLLKTLIQKKPELKKPIEAWVRSQEPNKKGFFNFFS